jgi:hypothetical protein
MDVMKTFPDGHFDLAIVDPPYSDDSPEGAVDLPRLVRLAAEASMRASEAEDVARSCYYTDPEMRRYAAAEMRKERAESRSLFALANIQAQATQPEEKR